MKKTTLLTLIIGLTLLSRWLPHPANFSPVLALALFSGSLTHKNNLWLSLAPIVGLILSDIYLGLHFVTPFVYLSILLIVVLGRRIQLNSNSFPFVSLNVKIFLASLVFFVVTNFSVWIQGMYYPMSFQGLMECYVAALPFYRNTLVSGVIYSHVLFLAYYFLFFRMKNKVPGHRFNS